MARKKTPSFLPTHYKTLHQITFHLTSIKPSSFFHYITQHNVVYYVVHNVVLHNWMLHLTGKKTPSFIGLHHITLRYITLGINENTIILLITLHHIASNNAAKLYINENTITLSICTLNNESSPCPNGKTRIGDAVHILIKEDQCKCNCKRLIFLLRISELSFPAQS